MPRDVQGEQLAAQLESMQGLIEVQSALPDRLEDMTGYAELIAERTVLQQKTGQLQGLLDQNVARTLEIKGDTEALTAQLGTVQNAVTQQQAYLTGLTASLQNVMTEIDRRKNFVLQTPGGEVPESLDLAALSSLDLASLDDVQLGRLYNDLQAVSGSVDRGLSTLAEQETEILGLIDANKGELTTVNDDIQVIQSTIGTTLAQITALDTQISQTDGALAILKTLEGVTDYAAIDTGLRGLQTYSNVLSPQMQEIVSGLVLEPPYINTLGTLQDLNIQFAQTEEALSLVSSLIEVQDTAALDTELRTLQSYKDMLSPEFSFLLDNLTTKATTPLTDLRSDLSTVQDAILWRQDLDRVQTDLSAVQSSLTLKQKDLTRVQDQLAVQRDLTVVTKELNTAQVNLSSTTAELERVNRQLMDLSGVSKLLNDTSNAFRDRFRIDQQKVEKVDAYYVYDTKYGGSAIRYDDQYWPLDSLNRNPFYEVSQEQLTILYSGLSDANDAIPQLQTDQTHLQKEKEFYQTQVSSLAAEKTTIEGLQSQRSTLESNISVLNTQQTNLLKEKNYLADLLTREDLLKYSLVELQAMEQDIKADITLLEGLVSQTASKLPTEQTYLKQETASLAKQIGTYTAILGSIKDILGLAIQALPSEKSLLENEISALNTQKARQLLTYERALSTESSLLAQKEALATEMSGLNNQAGILRNNLTTFQTRLASLDSQESLMKANLDGIIQQKWTERVQLGDNQRTYQNYEADFLRTAQELVMTQGSLALGGIIQEYRNNLDDISEQITFLRSELAKLKSKEALLLQQLQQVQAAQEGLLSVRIEALELQLASDVLRDDATEFRFNQFDLNGQLMPQDGEIVAQDDFSGYYLYQNPETEELYYRDVSGTPDDTSDDTFYARGVELEYSISGNTWRYRDIQGTPDDQSDDELYGLPVLGEVLGEVYPFDGTYVVRRLSGVTSEVRTETRSDTGQEYQVTIVSDKYSVEDYRYRFFSFASEPEFGVEELYALDTVTGQAVDFSSMLDDLEADLGDGGRLIVLYPGQTLQDLGIEAVTRNDITVTFLDFAPVYTPLSAGDFTFAEPVDYSGTEVEEVPSLFAEVLYQGQQLLPVVAREDGSINFSDVSLTASESLALTAANQINGLQAGEVLSAESVYIQSSEDLYIGGTLLGTEMVEIHTDGNLVLKETALIQGDSVNFVSELGSVIANEGSFVQGNTLIAETAGEVRVYGDLEKYLVNVTDAGDVLITDTDTLGEGKTVVLTDVQTANGLVEVISDATVQAASVKGSDITIFTKGEGSIEIGKLHTWGSTITLDAARYVREMDGRTSEVVAKDVNLVAGLDIDVPTQSWLVSHVFSRPNLSVLIDENYNGPLQISAERDIIVDAAVVAGEDVKLIAQNIVFTGRGSISNPQGKTTLRAGSTLRLGGTQTGASIAPALLGDSIEIEASVIQGGESALISGETLSVKANFGFDLQTEVRQLRANVTGTGDLRIRSLSSIELTDVDVLDGSIHVTSPGNILAKNVKINTDQYSNDLSLFAAGNISLDQVVVGQTTAVNFEAGIGFTNIENALIVVPHVFDDSIYEGESASFQIVLPDSLNFEIQVDFGDGTPVQTIFAPFFEPEPEKYGPAAQVIEGSKDGTWFGSSVAAGDVNGDGYADVVVGQGWDNRILLYLGTRDGLNPSPVTVIEGTQPDAGFGLRVAPAGDVNGDGYDDIIVAAPYQKTVTSITVVTESGEVEEQLVTLRGQVIVYQGTPKGLSSQPIWTLEGFEEDDAMRLVMSTAGDVDHDSFDDILVAEPYADVDRIGEKGLVHLVDAGKVQLFSGSENGLSREPAWIYLGQEEGGLLGSAVSPARDINGDGFKDVMIGSYREDGAGTSDNGHAYLFLGSESGLSDTPEQILEGDQDGAWFGSAISAAGDVNNDGYSDLVVGAPGRASADGKSGAVYLYLGSADGLQENPVFVNAVKGNTRFGWEVAGAGDVNRDSYSDILVRALVPNGDSAECRVFLYLGAADGLSNVVFQLDEGREVSAGHDDPAGSIAGVGDINGDGFDDMAIGAWTRGSQENGSLFVYEGMKLELEAPTVAMANFNHPYGDNGNYTVTVTVFGPGTGADLGSVKLTVNNVAPVLGNLQATAVDENGATTLKGTITDPGTLDSFELLVNWGDPLSPNNMEKYWFAAGTKSFELTHQFLDDNPGGTASDDYTIGLTITDDDGGESSANTNVKVNNVTPEITSLVNSAPEVGDARPGSAVTVTGAFTDVGTMDTHTTVINWGDGSVTSAVINEVAGTYSGSHVYATGGIFDIAVTLSDDDLSSIEQRTMALVSGARVKDGELQIVGTHSNDQVRINRVFGNRYKVYADFMSGRSHFAAFNSAEVTSIKILVGDGKDYAHIAGSIYLPALIDGGADDDLLRAGRGPAVLIGGSGNDTVYGSSGNDTIFSGDGNDIVYGLSGNDTIFGGDGNDRLFGQSGNDSIEAGAGDDAVFGGKGDDTVAGGAGNDEIFGDGGNDILDGGQGNDKLSGGDGDDKILGGNGNDLLGGAGKDTLYGSPGDDRLIDWHRDWDYYVPGNCIRHQARVSPSAPWVKDFVIDLAGNNDTNNLNSGIQVFLPSREVSIKCIGKSKFAVK